MTPLLPREDGAHPIDDPNYVEHWYFDARLESGHVVVGFLWASEMMSHKPGVELHIYKPDGEKVSVVKSYQHNDLRASQQKCDVWVGKNHAYGEYPEDGGLPVYYLHLSEGDLSADLVFRSEVPGWKPGGGKTIYGDEGFFAWVVAVPRARVEGNIKMGDQVIQVRGIGYHDHNWETADLKKILLHWYWGRVYTEDFTLLYAYVKTNDRFGNAASKPLMLAYGDKIIHSTGEMVLRGGPDVFNKQADRTYPANLKIELPEILSLELTVKEVIDAHDFVGDQNRLIKWAVNTFIGRPGWFRFNSDFSLRVVTDGKVHEQTGTTLHEMVALR